MENDFEKQSNDIKTEEVRSEVSEEFEGPIKKAGFEKKIEIKEQDIKESEELKRKEELEKVEEIKEQVKHEIKEEQQKEELKEEASTKVKRGIGKIISRIIWTAFFLFILFEAVMGILDMNRLSNDQEPVWYFDSKTEKTKNKTETTYNLGLYVIVKTTEGNEKRIELKPFFLK